MLIDWFTVGTQAINFLLLVWLLKRYLFEPVLRAVDERDRRIAAQIREAEALKAEAGKEQRDYQHKNAEFEQHRQALYHSAMEEAKAERQRLIREARQEFESSRKKYQESLQTEHHDLSQEISRRTRQEVFAISRQALADLASTSLEEQMAEVFIRRLHELNGEDKTQLTKAFASATRPVVVRSAFGLSPSRKTDLEQALRESYRLDVPVLFEIHPEQVSGIELTVNGYKLAWSIADYLAGLEGKIAELLNKTPEPQHASVPE